MSMVDSCKAAENSQPFSVHLLCKRTGNSLIQLLENTSKRGLSFRDCSSIDITDATGVWLQCYHVRWEFVNRAGISSARLCVCVCVRTLLSGCFLKMSTRGGERNLDCEPVCASQVFFPAFSELQSVVSVLVLWLIQRGSSYTEYV